MQVIPDSLSTGRMKRVPAGRKGFRSVREGLSALLASVVSNPSFYNIYKEELVFRYLLSPERDKVQHSLTFGFINLFF